MPTICFFLGIVFVLLILPLLDGISQIIGAFTVLIVNKITVSSQKYVCEMKKMIESKHGKYTSLIGFKSSEEEIEYLDDDEDDDDEEDSIRTEKNRIGFK